MAFCHWRNCVTVYRMYYLHIFSKCTLGAFRLSMIYHTFLCTIFVPKFPKTNYCISLYCTSRNRWYISPVWWKHKSHHRAWRVVKMTCRTHAYRSPKICISSSWARTWFCRSSISSCTRSCGERKK